MSGPAPAAPAVPPGVTVTTFAARPELVERCWEADADWPEFLTRDQVGNAFYPDAVADFPQYGVVATDDAIGRVVGRGLAVAYRAAGTDRPELPSGGWDAVQVWAHRDRRAGREPDRACALEITVDKDHLGRGLSSLLLTALRDAAAAAGADRLLVPLRPTGKHRHQRMPMADYIRRLRPDGLPEDAWLRVHVRAGGAVAGVAPAAMTVAGSLAEWREWTGLPFDTDGEVEVPGGLSPVRVSVADDYAVYVEPNVWVRHATR